MRARSQFLQIAGNFKTFQSVMDKYGEARKMAYPEVITRAAYQANKQCTMSEAKGGVKRPKLAQDKFLRNATDPSKYKKLDSGKYSKTNDARRIWFALAAKQGAKKGKPFKSVKVGPNDDKLTKVGASVKNISDNEKYLTKAAATIRNRRRSRAGAMAAGFLQSARRTAYKKIKGARNIQPVPGGSASKSLFHAPTKNNLKAFSINKVLGDFKIGRDAMLRAMTFVMADMKKFAEEELNKLANNAARQSKGGRR